MNSDNNTSDTGRIEQLMIVAIAAFGLFIFVGSYQFSGAASVFPQLTSGIVLVTGLLLLIRDYVSRSETKTESFEEQLAEIPEEISEDRSQEVIDNRTEFEKDELYSILFITAYVVSGILIGILWVTPLFVLSYARWQGLNWKRSAILSGLAFTIPFVIMIYLNVNYITGILTGGI